MYPILSTSLMSSNAKTLVLAAFVTVIVSGAVFTSQSMRGDLMTPVEEEAGMGGDVRPQGGEFPIDTGLRNPTPAETTDAAAVTGDVSRPLDPNASTDPENPTGYCIVYARGRAPNRAQCRPRTMVECWETFKDKSNVEFFDYTDAGWLACVARMDELNAPPEEDPENPRGYCLVDDKCIFSTQVACWGQGEFFVGMTDAQDCQERLSEMM